MSGSDAVGVYYQPVGPSIFGPGSTRSMTFMICEKGKTDPIPGCRHDLIIPPDQLSINEPSRDAINWTYGGANIQKHASKGYKEVRLSGNCLYAHRVIGTRTVSGISILRSLNDLFISSCGAYPSKSDPTKFCIRGSNGYFGEYDLDEIELRWFNWGLNIESQVSSDPYYSIQPTPMIFGTNWVKGKIYPTYQLNFLAWPIEADTTAMADEIKNYFNSTIFPDILQQLKDSGAWSWADRMATRMANMAAPFYNSLDNLRYAMERQNLERGSIPLDYGSLKNGWDQMRDLGKDLF